MQDYNHKARRGTNAFTFTELRIVHVFTVGCLTFAQILLPFKSQTFSMQKRTLYTPSLLENSRGVLHLLPWKYPGALEISRTWKKPGPLEFSRAPGKIQVSWKFPGGDLISHWTSSAPHSFWIFIDIISLSLQINSACLLAFTSHVCWHLCTAQVRLILRWNHSVDSTMWLPCE